MSLFLQLRLLLWKNFVNRKRQKLRCGVELMWPLCLFLLLMWVRTKGFHKRMHRCHFEEKPLPSSGQVLFYQGVLCTFNNTCHKYPIKPIYDQSAVNPSKFNEILSDIKTYGETAGQGNKSRLNAFLSNVKDLADVLQSLPIQNNQPNSSKSNITLHDVKSIKDLHGRLDRSINDMNPILKLIGLLDKIEYNYENLTDLLKEAPFLDDFFLKLHTYVCGSEVQISLRKLLEIREENYGIEYFVDLNRVPTTLHYDYDNESSPVCNEIYKKLETTRSLKLVWRTMKPFIKGKIIYSPNTTVINRIIRRVKKFMAPLSFPNFEMERKSVSLDMVVYLDAVKNLNIIKHFLTTFHNSKSQNIIGMDYLLKPKFYETVNRTENILKRFDEKYKRFRKNNFTLSDILKCYSQRDYEGYSSEKEAEVRSMELCDKNELLAQISFKNHFENKLDPIVSYKIRLNSERMPRMSELKSFTMKSGPSYRPIHDLKLITFGFIYLQDLFEKSIITELTGKEFSPSFVLKQLPYPCYIQDWFMSSLSDMFPLFMVLSWVYTSSMIVKSIVHEKEQKLKETMCVLGLNNTIYWCSWFIDSIIPMSITVCLLSIILVYGGILANANITLVIVFLMVFAIATISQSFLLSICFSKANQAASSSGIIYFITYLPFPFIEQWYTNFTPVSKLVACLFSNVALGLGSRYFSLRESEGTGCKWNNVTESPVDGDRFNLLVILVILLFDSFLYLTLAWYLENVFPGIYGIPKPWNFPFKKKYWCTDSSHQKAFKEKSATSIHSTGKQAPEENDVLEPVPDHLKVGVSIIDLCKTYKNNIVAITNLNINFYEDQITAFLGRNGAGKTTTISILTGLFPPSKGTATINGMDVRTHINTIRKNLGICPQYNLYFNCFTVEEHLWFFARLKGHSPGEAQVEIQQLLQDLGLAHKRRCLARYLSGGMKRKLSVAIAFIGGSKTVILDEPTAGVDPYSSIGIWELIQKNKQGRTIILTTHTMSEAELLGDRIAIFANGDLLCCGSSTFLKSKFGWGIVLTVDLNQLDHKEDDERTSKLSEAVSSIMPNSKLIDKLGTEIKFNLPKVDGNMEYYDKLFQFLESNRNLFGINTYGIADTSLEEIFMKLVGEHDHTDEKYILDTTASAKSLLHSVKKSDEKTSQKNRWTKQFKALHYKRLHHFKRSKLVFAMELILPTLFVCLCMLVTNNMPAVEHPQALVVDLSNCTNCTSFFEILPNTTYPIVSKYMEQLRKPSGLGIKCVSDNKSGDAGCRSSKFKPPGDHVAFGRNYSDCSCEAGVVTCFPNATYGKFPRFQIYSSAYKLGYGHEVINVTGSNVSQWILNTWPTYGSIRTGGYSFGLKLPTKGVALSTIMDDIKRENHPKIFDENAKNISDDKADNILIWFNNKWPLSPVAYLNAVNNLILRSNLPHEISHNHGIKLTIHHMNYTVAQYQSEILSKGAVALLHSVSLIFSLSFIPTAFILYLIEERNTKSKHLQFLSGVNWMVYWVQAFIWDMTCYFIASLFCAIALLTFGNEMYKSKNNFQCLFILILLYGWANIPFMYPASFYFHVSSSAFVTLSCINLFIGLTTTASTYVLRILKDEYLSSIEMTLRKILLIFPHFCFGEGVMKVAEMHLLKTSLSKYNIKLNFNLYSWDYLGKNYVSLFIEGIVFFSITLFYERFHNQGICPKYLVSLNPPEIMDDDVKEERNRILKSSVNDTLVLKCLTKVFKPKNFVAVNQISLGVDNGQCFGLLGLNGAGKTTTFMMLTGETTISFGDAFINGMSIRKDLSSVSSMIGYCPQTDALDSKLTPQEHLEMYAHLRNIAQHEIKKVVSTTLLTFDLVRYKDVCTKYLSGGNKRKLSTAIAILGYPAVIYLDEPTSGMDPKGRRFLWARIREIVINGHVVILTTHNMHECEVLCSRVTIMAHGQLMCLGTIQHIKNKFGQGYNLVVWSSYENISKIQELFKSLLPEAILKSSHHTQIKYYLPIDTLCLSKVLSHLENLKKKQLAYDYSLSQKTLDEIFMHFVTKHTNPEELESQKCSLIRSLFCGHYRKSRDEKFVKKM